MTQAQSATSVLDFIQERVEKFADRPALCIKEGGAWREMTYAELSAQAKNLSSYFIEVGIQSGDRVALLSEGKPEWGVAFFGAIRAGAIVVPLDVKLTEAELTNILSDCTPKVVLADSKHMPVVDALAKKVTSIKHILNIDPGKGDAEHPGISTLAPKEAKRRERSEDEVALIVYTSGTTGNPKGVMTTFGNLMFEVTRFKEMAGLTENDRFLSILPLNHLLELTGGFLGMLTQGATICFCQSLFPQEIIKTMAERQITGMIAVPLFFKTLKGAIEREAKKAGEAMLQKLQAGLEKAEAMPHEMRRQMFGMVHQQFGGKLRVFVSGGAPLDVEVAHFFERLGIPLLQGYGLTETSPVITGNSLSANRLGSVGRALPGVELRIDLKDKADTEGEILCRGPHVMKGYYKREDLTNEVIDKDGWFHTGDLGHIDAEGFLHITGRIKNLIVLGGGKKVFPEEVETALGGGTTIKEICVLSRKQSDGFKEGTEEVCAVVVASDALSAECKGDKTQVQKRVKEEMDKLCENLAPYKRPTRIFFYEGDLPKTATRKVKRPLVAEWLQSQN
ncbi:MAG TPA: AMP-binding protein [Candidatus Obscuribacterales bacterium]